MDVVEIKTKEKREGQRVCDEKNEKGKLCLGHLKRWYKIPTEIAKQMGRNTPIYRCDKCHTLYQPAAGDRSSAGQKYVERTVNLLGNPVRSRRD